MSGATPATTGIRPGAHDVEHGVRVDRGDVADQPDVDGLAADERRALLGGEQARVLTGQADGVGPVLVDQADQLPADLADQHHPHDVDRLRGGDAQAAAELGGRGPAGRASR